MEIGFIEPCCASRQLPALFREQKVAAFQTNGDVTFEHILKAVAALAGDVLSIRFMIPTVNVEMLRVLAWFGRRGWLKRLQVLTQDKQDGFICKEVADCVPCVSCYHNERVVEQLLVIDGEKGSVAVTGQFLTSVDPGHRFYTAAVGKTGSDHVRMFTATMTPLMRIEDSPTPEATHSAGIVAFTPETTPPIEDQETATAAEDKPATTVSRKKHKR